MRNREYLLFIIRIFVLDIIISAVMKILSVIKHIDIGSIMDIFEIKFVVKYILNKIARSVIIIIFAQVDHHNFVFEYFMEVIIIIIIMIKLSFNIYLWI